MSDRRYGVDLTHSPVRGVMPTNAGGTGNRNGFVGTVTMTYGVPTDLTVRLGSVVELAGAYMVREAQTANGTNALGVYIGTWDHDLAADPYGELGLFLHLVDCDEHHAATIAVQGVARVRIGADVTAGQYAYIYADDGKAYSSATLSAGAFGIFMTSGDESVYAYALVKLGVLSAGGGSGSASLEVKEVDGTPDVTDVAVIRVPNGSLTDDGGGQVTLAFPAGGAIEVKEVDGTPDVTGVTKVVLPNGSLTDGGGGQVTVAFPAAGVTDHGALTGLADDDHPQYTTDAESAVIAAAAVTTHLGAATHVTYGAAGDIHASAPGDAASAGSTGKVADAGHVHAREAKEVSDLVFIIDGGGAPPATGIKVFGVVVDFPCSVTGWTLLADIAGTVAVDVWKAAYGSYPPTVANTIVGAGTKPALSGVRKNQSTSPDWTTLAIAAGDVLFVNLDTCVTSTWLSLTLRLRRDGSA